MILSYFVYSSIPGSGKGWSLAVLATSRKDADEYIRKHHKSGKFSYDVRGGGTVKANCGAVTEDAAQILKEQK